MDTKELAREHREHSVLSGHPSLALYFASAFFSLSGMFRKLEMMELQQQQKKGDQMFLSTFLSSSFLFHQIDINLKHICQLYKPLIAVPC